MQSRDAMQAAHLALLEGAVRCLMAAALEQDLDGLTIQVTADAGQIAIDLSYTANGVPVSGESL
jgi:predicted HD phosphohydrolase